MDNAPSIVYEFFCNLKIGWERYPEELKPPLLFQTDQNVFLLFICSVRFFLFFSALVKLNFCHFKIIFQDYFILLFTIRLSLFVS